MRLGITNNYPPGLNFNSVTGTLSGNPTTAGNYSGIVVTATNAAGSAPRTFNFSVGITPPIPPGPTPVPVMDGLWLLPGMLAGLGMFARRRKE